jgi:hypothetical protein
LRFWTTELPKDLIDVLSGGLIDAPVTPGVTRVSESIVLVEVTGAGAEKECNMRDDDGC